MQGLSKTCNTFWKKEEWFSVTKRKLILWNCAKSRLLQKIAYTIDLCMYRDIQSGLISVLVMQSRLLHKSSLIWVNKCCICRRGFFCRWQSRQLLLWVEVLVLWVYAMSFLNIQNGFLFIRYMCSAYPVKMFSHWLISYKCDVRAQENPRSALGYIRLDCALIK